MRTAAPTKTRSLRAPAGFRAPGRWSAAVFAAKVALLQLRRGIQDIGTRPPRLRREPSRPGAAVVAESRTPLWSDVRVAESGHQRGKVQNLRRAVQALDGVVIPADQTFSFWRQLGRASRARGFVSGRMLQQGCMVPAVGGGLCQLSNALYDAALQAGCAIIERHAHSRLVPGSAAMQGRDATVAWNYVDLRFRPGQTLHLTIQLTADELILRLLGSGGSRTERPIAAARDDRAPASSCGSCAETTCFRHEAGASAPPGRQLFLLDEAWPEFVAPLETARREGSTLARPLAGRLGRLGRDSWPTQGYAHVRSAPLAAVTRSAAVRLAAPGAATRQAQIAGAARIAGRLARLLTPDIAELWVAQSYLPHLWRAGHLGGRRFSVLLTRLPMHLLEARLDAAFQAHPDRTTLADYRAPRALVEWEAEALAQAESILTPHAELAAQFPGRAIRPPWSAPSASTAAAVGRAPALRRIAFPGPTLARKGAHEVREAARALDLEVVLLGAELEGAGFWRGVRTRRPEPGGASSAWLDGVAAVVQPSLVEDQPRRLLAARAAGVPVLASAACGLDGSGVIEVAPLDPAGLIDRLRLVLASGKSHTIGHEG